MADRSKLESKLRRVETEKSGTYDKRTEHIDRDGKAIFINRLILEDSPYLLQHAHNPVNWYAWGAEAFANAKADNKPIFLSIGYSTCHWCHVMEVESFDNVDVARLLNEHFISIKLDREQYPDIDEVYMTGVQMMSGGGGWPMSNFLLADGKPFFGATYFPAASFISLLQKIASAWQQQRQQLETSASEISDTIARVLAERKQADALDPQISDTTLQALLQREDKHYGGLAGAPKFPQEPLLLFMLDVALRQRQLDAMGFVDRALEGMAQGGIYDQVGGGFARYSVDAQWLVPHFEKMLYNQSQLGLVYLQAYQLSGKPFFKRVLEQTLNYVLRDMQIPAGGFYSATDADSEGSEGVFFLWSEDQLQAVLNPYELELVTALYGVTAAGNFEGSNILHLSQPLQQSTREFEQGDFLEQLDAIRLKLYQAREQRVHPLRDDKLIVAWTGAMIATLARAACQFDNEAWLHAAERAASCVWQHCFDGEKGLQRIYLGGIVSIAGQLEDYANFTLALLLLFDVTGRQDYLQQAVQLMDSAFAEFWDEDAGGFYLSPQRQLGPQLTRSRKASDGATLSAVANALECLSMLQRRAALIEQPPAIDQPSSSDQPTGADELRSDDPSRRNAELFYREKVEECIASLLADINDNPQSHSSLLRVIENHQHGGSDLIQYAGQGRARVQMKKGYQAAGIRQLEIRISLQAGWHITAPQQGGDKLVPINLRLAASEGHWQLSECAYPDANGKLSVGAMGAVSATVAIYENELLLRPELRRSDLPEDLLSASVGIELTLQLCNDENCLLPEILQFRV